MAKDVLAPAEILDQVVNPPTCMGLDLYVVVSSPNCPLLLLPQFQIVPSVLIALLLYYLIETNDHVVNAPI